MPPLVLSDVQIHFVANGMVDSGYSSVGGWSGMPTSSDAGIPAGWTYFAQFVDHDITLDSTSLIDQADDPDALESFRTPRLDLGSVYGLGPATNPWLYDQDDPDKLLLGSNPPGFSQKDLNRNHQGRALIGDPRNDAHVVIAQLHLAFVEFHNHVVDRVRADPSLVVGVPATPVGSWWRGTPPAGRPTFGQIVTLVRWHYQWLVLTEFLPVIAGSEAVDEVLRRDEQERLDAVLPLYTVRGRSWLPVEFSAAAFRFGHSLVRDAYRLNGGLSPLPVYCTDGDVDPLADLRGFRRLPAGWEVEWHRFFDGLPGSGADTQQARLFDTRVSPCLHALPPSIDHLQRSLAVLDLERGVAVELPSGEDFATAVAGRLRLDPSSVAVLTGLPHPAPLWFWFLKEAEVARGGRCLGPIGGRVVVEVLVGLAANDPTSFLGAQPGWRPTLGARPGQFTVVDLLTIAGVPL